MWVYIPVVDLGAFALFARFRWSTLKTTTVTPGCRGAVATRPSWLATPAQPGTCPGTGAGSAARARARQWRTPCWTSSASADLEHLSSVAVESFCEKNRPGPQPWVGEFCFWKPTDCTSLPCREYGSRGTASFLKIGLRQITCKLVTSNHRSRIHDERQNACSDSKLMLYWVQHWLQSGDKGTTHAGYKVNSQ